MKHIKTMVIALLVALSMYQVSYAQLLNRKASQLDSSSALSRDIERLLRGVQDAGGQGLTPFELGEYASIFLTEKAHEIVFRAYRETQRGEPTLLSIVDPAYKTAHMLLQQSFMGRLRPKNQSGQVIIQILNDIVENDIDAIVAAVKAALSISDIKIDKHAYAAKAEDAIEKVESLQTKISDLQKVAEPVKKQSGVVPQKGNK